MTVAGLEREESVLWLGREGGRKGGREGGRKGGREGGRDGRNTEHSAAIEEQWPPLLPHLRMLCGGMAVQVLARAVSSCALARHSLRLASGPLRWATTGESS